MEDWDPSWKPHHLPMWFKKVLRKVAIERGDWEPGLPVEYFFQNRHPLAGSGLWDHWGSIDGENGRKVISQPYSDKSKFAKQFADEHGMKLTISKPGPWHEATWMFVFEQKK